VNYTKPNEFKFKGNGNGIEYTMIFSNDKIKIIDEFGKELKEQKKN
jgi:hypothetical protein